MKHDNEQKKITIVDVVPRDGLQSESKILSPETRAALINRIAQAGVPRIAIQPLFPI